MTNTKKNRTDFKPFNSKYSSILHDSCIVFKRFRQSGSKDSSIIDKIGNRIKKVMLVKK